MMPPAVLLTAQERGGKTGRSSHPAARASYLWRGCASSNHSAAAAFCASNPGFAFIVGGLKYEVQHLSGDNVLPWEQTINS